MAEIAPLRRLVIPQAAPTGWSPLLVQSPLNVATDYFDVGSLDSKWTLWNPAGNTTVSVSAAQRLTMTQAASGGPVLFGGIIQPAPAAAQFVVTAYLSLAGSAENYVSTAVLIGGDLIGDPTGAPFMLMEHYDNGTPSSILSFNDWLTYNAASQHTQFDAAQSAGFGGIMLRLAVDTVAGFAYGLMGELGNDFSSLQRIDIPSTVLQGGIGSIGIALKNQLAGGFTPELKVNCGMFRVDETDDPYALCGGYA